jgi:hypothetical protein
LAEDCSRPHPEVLKLAHKIRDNPDKKTKKLSGMSYTTEEDEGPALKRNGYVIEYAKKIVVPGGLNSGTYEAIFSDYNNVIGLNSDIEYDRRLKRDGCLEINSLNNKWPNVNVKDLLIDACFTEDSERVYGLRNDAGEIIYFDSRTPPWLRNVSDEQIARQAYLKFIQELNKAI